jgi:hypothetical protein
MMTIVMFWIFMFLRKIVKLKLFKKQKDNRLVSLTIYL